MLYFILVHGTFERKSKFTLSGSRLRDSIAAACRRSGQGALSDVDFFSPRWTGRNRILDRRTAAQDIAQRVRKVQGANDPIFLIGHSHGGSAVAYFLKNFPELGERIAGCAFLSTPFVAMRLRNYWTDVAAVMFAVVSLVGVLGVAKLASIWIDVIGEWVLQGPAASYPLGRFGDLLRYALFRVVFGALPFYAVAIAAVYFLRRRYWLRYLRFLRARLRRNIAEQETINMPKGNYIFFRATGDEAAAALSAAQSLAWIVHTAFLKLATWLSALLNLCSIVWRTIPGKLILLVLSFDCFATFSYFQTPGRTFSYFFSGMFFAGTNFTWDIAFTSGVTQSLLILHALLIQPIVAFVLLSVLLALALFVVMAIVSTLGARAFGWSGTFEAIFVEFAVEPIPVGATTIHHVEWQDYQKGLMHSVTYDDDTSLSELTSWILDGVRRHRA
jgi:pimeloyl-ACP methyl ester carboxylesterase